MTETNPIHEARRHYLCALYRSVFHDRRKNTEIICWSQQVAGQAGVSTTEAQILVRHRMALIRVATDTGQAYLTATTTGARKSIQNRVLTSVTGVELSVVPKGRDVTPVDMSQVSDACSRFTHKFAVKDLY